MDMTTTSLIISGTVNFGSALFGFGVGYGIVKAKLSDLKETMEDNKKDIRDRIDRVETGLEIRCRDKQVLCQKSVEIQFGYGVERMERMEEKLDVLVKQLNFIAGTISSKKKGDI